ncbi:hypothetical protein JW848_00380 [Candidatus Bipolaricaulota bacterium]|nr:hypothetical protein [Candidatus Bipolaricaulota bacterium]
MTKGGSRVFAVGLLVVAGVVFGCFGVVLYEQDFSSSWPSAWDTASSSVSERWIAQGAYQVVARSPQFPTTGLLEGSAFYTGAIELNASQQSGTPHCSYGIVFGYVNEQSYLKFCITGDGYVELNQVVAGETKVLVGRRRCFVSHLGHEAVNRLRVEVDGRVCRFYVNGCRVMECLDLLIPCGEIGVVVATLQDDEVCVAFDDIRVHDPSVVATVSATGTP